MREAGEHSSFVTAYYPRLESQQEFSAALGAGVLGQKDNARLRLLGSSPVAEPSCQWNTQGMFWRDTTHIKYDCTEASGLQEQIGHAERLFDAR
jgi:hypothetical protein